MAPRKSKNTDTPRRKMVVASAAKVIAGRRIGRTPNANWQEEAWGLFDSMGELRFAASWIANSASRVNLRLGRVGEGGSEPVPVRATPEQPLTPLETDAAQLVAELGGGPVRLPGLVQHLATLLAVVGLGWILIEEDPKSPTGWKWTVRSNDEIRDTGEHWEVETGLDDDPEWDDQSWRPVATNNVMIRVWRRHPRHADVPDSPVRAVIPVLKQLKGIDAHVNATSKSRLAGAGILFSPSEVEYQSANDADDDADDAADNDDVDVSTADSLLDDLIQNASRAAEDPDDPAAVIPLPIEVPAEYIEAFRHMTFSTEYSETVIELTDRAIRRFALGMDMPPEAVTGMSDASHWAAWRVAEEGVTIHIAPLVEVITTGVTLNWLHINLEALGHDPIEVSKLVIFGDTTSLLVRPDKSADAIAGYENLEVSGEAMRRESGLPEEDKPSESEFLRRLLMRSMDRNPELTPVLLPVISQPVITPETIAAIEWPDLNYDQQNFGVRSMDGNRSRRDQFEQAGQSQPTPIKTQADNPAQDPMAASALIASMDGVVYRALERAGNRMRSDIGKGVPGGNSMVASGVEPYEVHTVIKVDPKKVSPLVAGAFDRVAELADRLGLDGPSLTASVESYTRDLLTTGTAHTVEALASWLAAA